MKPLKLEMTAFGSYAEPTAVPFDALRPGLCLITGDTGAGKTTIFDGIVFALYGTASGRDRAPEMMHSDLADPSVDTVVKLCFSQAGKRYTVVRSIHFPKKRKSESGYGAPIIQAQLTGDGLVPVEGATRVSAACEALLGLNAEQFRKIVMLAQGEFRDFLKADSEKKNEILGKLFDSSAYLWYQRLLDGARQALAAERQEDREALRRALDGLVLPEGADPARFLPEEPGLLDNLDALLAEGRAALEALTARLREAEQTHNALLKQQGEAESLNKDLDRLDRDRARLAQLNGQAAEMDRRRKALDRAELALRKAVPALREAERSARERDAARENLDRLERRAVIRAQDYEHAREARVGDDKLTERKEQIAASLRELEDQLRLFADLNAAEKALKEAETARDEGRARLEALKRDNAELEGLQKERKAALEASENVKLLEAQARSEAEAARTLLDGIAGKEGLRPRCAQLTDLEQQLEDQERRYRQFIPSVQQAQKAYHALYSRFLAGQAGFLAGELRRTVESEGAGFCPVCGSRLEAGDLDHLAPSDAEIPDRETVEAAKAEAERREQKRQKGRDSLDRRWDRLHADQEALVRDARALLRDCESWNALSSPGWLERAEAEARSGSVEAQRVLQTARERVAARESLLKDQAAGERTLAALLPELEAARENLTDRETAYGAAAREAEVLRDRLRWPDETAAREHRAKLKNENAQVCQLLKAHESQEKQAKEALDTLNGQLRNAEETLKTLTAAAETAEAAKAAALAETGFLEAAAVTEALAPARGLEPETWLKLERSVLTAWDNERQNLDGTVRELAEKTDGRERADLDALEAAFLEADAACQALRTESRGLEQRIEDQARVRSAVARRLEALASTDAAWASLDRLGGLAAGTTGQGGKLSFERYVMGAVFREILEQANRRLDAISGGRYQLEHKAAADRASAKAGLEIEILDLTTGKRRPSASLSGGEAFYTSLALALGLSDTVQSRAGGMKLEALFIDEGFGSLDEDMLDNALAVLNGLSGGDRLVGIISHVDKLSASIPQKIIVKNSPKGSSLRVVV